jgi:DNA repair exonuclease SbcCD ATPase subunit
MAVNLHIQNFKIHVDLMLTLQSGCEVDLLVARNGMGKSTVVDAVEFVLRGSGALAGIHSKKELGALSVHDDAQGCSVSLCLGSGKGVTRSMLRSGSQTLVLHEHGKPDIEGKITVQQTRLDEIFKLDEKKLTAVLDARRLLDGDSNQRRAVIFGATGVKATQAQVLNALKALGLEGGDALKAASDVVESGWRPAETLAGEIRARIGREGKALQQPELVRHFKAGPDDDPADLEIWTLPKLQQIYQVQEAAHASAIASDGADVGAATEALRAAKAEHERAVTERNMLTGQASEASIELLAKLNKEAADEKNEAIEARTACDDHLEALEKLIPSDPETICKPEVCPAIEGGPPCPMTKAELAKHRTTMKGSDEDLDAQIATAREQVDLTRTRVDTAITMHGTAAGSLGTEQQRVQSLALVHDRLDRIEVTIADKEAALIEVKALAAKGGNVEFLSNRMAHTRATMSARERYENDVEVLGTYDSEVARLRDEHRRADKIAKALKPSGIESTLLKELIGPFEVKLNEIGHHLGELRWQVAPLPAAEREHPRTDGNRCSARDRIACRLPVPTHRPRRSPGCGRQGGTACSPG